MPTKKPEKERVTAAVAGLEFESTHGPNNEVVRHTVGAACASSAGSWYCITHGQGFRSQLEKDSHISRGDHVLVWVCLEHGPEAPV